jgi:tellurite resistance protein TerC
MHSIKKSILWTIFWVSSALLFDVGIYFYCGEQKALEFLSGYFIEESLSIDNLFVFLLIFSYFKISIPNQHRILFWGIFGAIVMRAVFILSGTALMAKFHWLIYVLGIFLVVIGIKMLMAKTDEDVGKNSVLKFLRKFLPIAHGYEGKSFLIKMDGKLLVTPMMVVLLMIEISDLIFAMDSLPAIFAITLDPFIVYASNIFAILGLRSLYFVLSASMGLFCYLKYGISVILVFIGSKMLTKEIYDISIGFTLIFIVSALSVCILASLIRRRYEMVKRIH